MIKFKATFTTSGDGYWSTQRKNVDVTSLSLPYVNAEGNFGELRVHFDTKTWNVDDDGLIYTDRRFLRELQDKLIDAGFAGSDIDYSEQGMQGRNYVSLDVGPDFIETWKELIGVKA